MSRMVKFLLVKLLLFTGMQAIFLAMIRHRTWKNVSPRNMVSGRTRAQEHRSFELFIISRGTI